VVKGRAAECGAGCRRQRRERNYFDGLEEQMRGAIAPHRLECDEDAPVGPAVDAVLDERGADEIAAELLKAGTIVGGTQTLAWRCYPSRPADGLVSREDQAVQLP